MADIVTLSCMNGSPAYNTHLFIYFSMIWAKWWWLLAYCVTYWYMGPMPSFLSQF